MTAQHGNQHWGGGGLGDGGLQRGKQQAQAANALQHQLQVWELRIKASTAQLNDI